MLLFVTLVAAFALSWVVLDEIPLVVIGQPTTTGLMQEAKEAPFFRDLARITGLPLQVTYTPINETGLKDTYQLQMLREGVFDLVSLRFIQNSEAEPSLQGIDLVGLYADFETARRVARSYAATVDRYLRETFDAKLLGVWTFGPQVFFCRHPIQHLDDLAGLKVRVASPSMASLITALGGTPAIIAFDETRNALADGLVDCAITSAASANYAGWAEHSQAYFPLAVHFGLNGYAISLKKWAQFSRRQQEILQDAFDAYLDDLWAFSQAIHADASSCNVGGDCQWGKPYQMALVEPSPHDSQRLKALAQTLLLPEWAEKCERVHPGCRTEWEAKVLALVP
ncbi:MAG TPA: TRAP transporter substrate-binding protein DctP [Chromatiaceae bacterium]|nr:TRAP transporter substrate-binding protein DctP [Chromatiaceae bacterium]